MKMLALFLIFSSLAIAEDVLPKRAPAPKDNPITEEKIEFGKQLYFDPRLSSTKTVSCHSCHGVISGENKPASGTDNSPVSTGIAGLKGGRNAPTVLNSGMRSALFWDGRAASLEEQAKGPLINPVEMGMPDHKAVVDVVAAIPEYKTKFKKIFNSEVNIDGIAKAIATYERTLMTPDSPFDRYQKGDKKAMSKEALRGWKKFNSFACNACHGVPTFSNREIYMRFPVHAAADYDYLYGFTKDLGRYSTTKDEKDKNFWRVPSLRNVELTGPYFHNGAVDKLEQAVRIMGKAQLGREFAENDVKDLVSFLKSLTGKIPKQTPPHLPGLHQGTK